MHTTCLLSTSILNKNYALLTIISIVSPAFILLIASCNTSINKSQESGTAGPSKTYTATYTPDQPGNFNEPVSGSGNTIELQYTESRFSLHPLDCNI